MDSTILIRTILLAVMHYIEFLLNYYPAEMHEALPCRLQSPHVNSCVARLRIYVPPSLSFGPPRLY